MIDYTFCPDQPIRTGQDKRARGYITEWLNSVRNVPSNLDASGGKIAAAVNSNTPLFVTSYQYVQGYGSFTCMNVLVQRQDYRLYIGYDDQVIRVEPLDAQAALAQTRKEASKWIRKDTPPPAVPDDGDPADNYNTDPPYANDPNPASSASPYGVAIPANPYGVPIPAE